MIINDRFYKIRSQAIKRTDLPYLKVSRLVKLASPKKLFYLPLTAYRLPLTAYRLSLIAYKMSSIATNIRTVTAQPIMGTFHFMNGDVVTSMIRRMATGHVTLSYYDTDLNRIARHHLSMPGNCFCRINFLPPPDEKEEHKQQSRAVHLHPQAENHLYVFVDSSDCFSCSHLIYPARDDPYFGKPTKLPFTLHPAYSVRLNEIPFHKRELLYQPYDVSITRGLKSVDRIQSSITLDESDQTTQVIEQFPQNGKNTHTLHVFYHLPTQAFAVFLGKMEQKRSLWKWFPTLELALAQPFRLHTYLLIIDHSPQIWMEDYEDFILMDEVVTCVVEGFHIAVSTFPSQ